jgi:hypothetical protein
MSDKNMFGESERPDDPQGMGCMVFGTVSIGASFGIPRAPRVDGDTAEAIEQTGRHFAPGKRRAAAVVLKDKRGLSCSRVSDVQLDTVARNCHNTTSFLVTPEEMSGSTAHFLQTPCAL